ncbi:sensor histidine kinase [Pseudomonas fluorescens]|uniref:histidine kinase n=1 Tax=Pseudomonas fluorescens TaxID=294 RepID=A0A944DJS6_PSEFL|nr:ATP-binding protein [Pseudomonas fluorescens]MBT2297626.1 sensor histidine kinase N-terminal domain-containing protein [Pseudomonas fluorescens]MBT2305824.1 sensor histidine kinase N-terminal domain-containing protein [Pseudomonas fluorescens]MBT2314153.1 sensor histidine kinase N-terminal domain-containing protein [Pseudomonas fluorescens]MBT2319355.1 sensor histidine kinase N-terminal domain-containing protein [Pseudomonas fluorescens]MBT2329228.1 sensor histidine kinase N-terminal domain
MTSIRRRTLTLILGLLFVGLLIITVFNLHDSNHEIAEVYDAQLAQNARLLQGVMRMPMASKEHAQLYQAFNSALASAVPKVDGHPYESKIAFQVWDSKGALLVHTSSAPTFTSPPIAPGFSDVIDQKERIWRAFVLDDTQYGLKIWVGERDDVRADLVDRIVRHTVVPNLIGSLILAAVIWLAIGWGLKPLVDMAAKLRARHPGSLEPLQLVPLPSELEPMQAALNRVLAQIQELMGRERRFIADAAHEMRTPLAVLRVHAQNLMEAGNEQSRRESLHHLIVGVDRTTRLVNQLLTMARLEPQAGVPAPGVIDLPATVRESLGQMTPWLLSKGLELVLDVSDDIGPVRIDPVSIDIALNNLVTNAANFSPANGLITVRLARQGDHYELAVEDQGPGIDEAERGRLFERFYSRGNDQGAGLGLTIVQTIAKRLGGQVRLENRPEGGLRATLQMGRL